MKAKHLVWIYMLIVLGNIPVGAQTTKEQEDYCQYVTEQAKAQRDLLRTPSALVGPIQPSTGTPPQMVVGVTESLSNLKKASLTMKVADTACGLYITQSEAQKHILYALPSIEQSVLQNRLKLIQDASNQLDALITDNQKLVDAQELTRQSIYILQEAKVRLDMSRTDTLTGLTTPYVPSLSNIPLKMLVDHKTQADKENQDAINKLAKQSAWDVKLEGGEHYQISSHANQSGGPSGMYGEFSLTYNFGRKAVDEHLDNSITDYVEWKRNQFDDVVSEAAILKEQIQDTIEIQSKQLEILLDHEGQIKQNLALLNGVSTNTSLTFKNQLLADEITLQVDIQDVQFRIKCLRDYAQNNF